MAKSNILKLVIALLITIGLGSLGGLFTYPEIKTWYATLQKPSFQPPNWLFGPVWTLLYTLMGIGVYLVWKLPATARRNKALAVFMIQFILNFCWSIIFFNQHQTGWAFIEIIVMWVCILLTIIQFSKLSYPAAWLLVPYILWVSFATVLNGAIWKLNS